MAESQPADMTEEQHTDLPGFHFDVHSRCDLLPDSNPSRWFYNQPYEAIQFVLSDTQVYAAFSLLQSYVSSTFRSASGRELTKGEYADILSRTEHLPPQQQSRILDYFFQLYQQPQILAPPDPTPTELEATELARHVVDHCLGRSTSYSHHGRNFSTCIKQMLMGIAFGQTIQEVLWSRETDGGAWNGYGVVHDIVHCFAGDFLWNADNELEYQNALVPPRKFITWAFDSYFENNEGMSLFAKLAWPVYYAWSANDTGNLTLNRYAAPFADVEISKDAKDLNKKFKKWMENILPRLRSFAGIAHSSDEKVTMNAGMRPGAFEDFASAVRLQYRQISKVLLGSALALEEGEHGSLALAESTAAPALRAIVDDLVGAVNETYSRTLLSWLTLWNFPAGTRPPRLELTLPRQVIPSQDGNTATNPGHTDDAEER